MDKGAWQATVHEVTKSQTRLSVRARAHTHTHTHTHTHMGYRQIHQCFLLASSFV